MNLGNWGLTTFHNDSPLSPGSSQCHGSMKNVNGISSIPSTPNSNASHTFTPQERSPIARPRPEGSPGAHVRVSLLWVGASKQSPLKSVLDRGSSRAPGFIRFTVQGSKPGAPPTRASGEAKSLLCLPRSSDPRGKAMEKSGPLSLSKVYVIVLMSGGRVVCGLRFLWEKLL